MHSFSHAKKSAKGYFTYKFVKRLGAIELSAGPCITLIKSPGPSRYRTSSVEPEGDYLFFGVLEGGLLERGACD